MESTLIYLTEYLQDLTWYNVNGLPILIERLFPVAAADDSKRSQLLTHFLHRKLTVDGAVSTIARGCVNYECSGTTLANTQKRPSQGLHPMTHIVILQWKEVFHLPQIWMCNSAEQKRVAVAGGMFLYHGNGKMWQTEITVTLLGLQFPGACFTQQ